MIYEPLEDRVVILPDETPKEYETNSGFKLEMTATAQKSQKPSRGTVTYVGPGKPDRPMTLKEGDRVIFGKYAGTLVEDDEKDADGNPINLLFMRTTDVFAKIFDKPKGE